MIKSRVTAFTLAGLLTVAASAAFAASSSSTGPTDPIQTTDGPYNGTSNRGHDVSGQATSPNSSTPGTENSMDDDGTGNKTGGNGGGMSNGNGMGGSGGGTSSGTK